MVDPSFLLFTTCDTLVEQAYEVWSTGVGISTIRNECTHISLRDPARIVILR
jgi:hypothetical protein